VSDKNVRKQDAKKGQAQQAKAPVSSRPQQTKQKQNGTHAAEHARSVGNRGPRGVTVARMFTKPGKDPLASGAQSARSAAGFPVSQELVYERRSSVITNPDGSIVFKMEGAEIPSGWSQLATDIVISKYFRKAGLFGDPKQGERSVQQVVYRIAHTIREAGEKFGGYFATKADAEAFESELSFLMVHQIGAFNSPVWFNCGLWAQYGITGPTSGSTTPRS
jgi:ribonucleoside-diphosphate reductase alpha chain